MFIAAADARVRFCGRTVATGDGSVRFDWPLTSVTFVVRGSTSVRLRMDGGKNIFAIDVGGTRSTLVTKRHAVEEYVVALDLDASAATTITIVKRTEAKVEWGVLASSGSAVTMHGVLLDASGELTPAPTLPERTLEVFGDSDTCAYGNEGPRTGSSIFSMINSLRPVEQDASRSWAAIVGASLNAQVHMIAWSGVGVAWNAPLVNADAPMAGMWSRLLATDPAAGTVHASGGWLPDALLLFVGGNDYWTMGDAPPIGRRNPQRSEAAFVEAFAAWIRTLRDARPAPRPILVLHCDEASGSCLPSPAAQQAFSEVSGRVLRAAVERADDAHTHVLPLRGEPAVDFADDADWARIGHWSVQGHAKVGRHVAARLGERLGWGAPAVT